MTSDPASAPKSQQQDRIPGCILLAFALSIGIWVALFLAAPPLVLAIIQFAVRMGDAWQRMCNF